MVSPGRGHAGTEITRSAFRLPTTTMLPGGIPLPFHTARCCRAVTRQPYIGHYRCCADSTPFDLTPARRPNTEVDVTHEPRLDPDTQLELDGTGLRSLLDEVAARLAAYL